MIIMDMAIMNKDKLCVKYSYIDVLWDGVWFGYAFYAYGASINEEDIECYYDDTWDDVDMCYMDSSYKKSSVKNVIKKFLNLKNKKDYNYDDFIYEADGMKLKLSYVDDVMEWDD